MSSEDKSEFEIERSAVGRVQGHEVEFEQSAVLFAKGDEVELKQSALVAAVGRLVSLDNSAALVVLAPKIVGVGRTALTLHGIVGFALGFALAKWLGSRTRKQSRFGDRSERRRSTGD